MNRLYNWDLYDREKIDSDRIITTIHEAWITSGYVIAENIDEEKKNWEKVLIWQVENIC